MTVKFPQWLVGSDILRGNIHTFEILCKGYQWLVDRSHHQCHQCADSSSIGEICLWAWRCRRTGSAKLGLSPSRHGRDAHQNYKRQHNFDFVLNQSLSWLSKLILRLSIGYLLVWSAMCVNITAQCTLCKQSRLNHSQSTHCGSFVKFMYMYLHISHIASFSNNYMYACNLKLKDNVILPIP